jgi:hypothetical protein
MTMRNAPQGALTAAKRARCKNRENFLLESITRPKAAVDRLADEFTGSEGVISFV